MLEAIAYTRLMAVGKVGTHFRIADEPIATRLRIEPDDPAGALMDCLQEGLTRVSEVIARIAKDNDRGAMVDFVEAKIMQISERSPIVR